MDTPTVSSPASPSRIKVFVVNAFYIGLAVGLALLIQAFIVRPFIVSGSSMDPTIKDKEYLIIDEVSYRFREPVRGDVVVFKAPPEPDKYYIKRIIGLPGETVTIRQGKVTIINAEHPDGLVLDEPYITHPEQDTVTEVVPEGSYFVMGDNRAGSYDSRRWGPLEKEEIRGRAVLRLLPFTAIDYLPGYTTYDTKQ